MLLLAMTALHLLSQFPSSYIDIGAFLRQQERAGETEPGFRKKLNGKQEYDSTARDEIRDERAITSIDS